MVEKRIVWYKTIMTTSLSILGLPEIDRAGYFPLLNPTHEFAYRSRTNALHFYEYAGTLRVGSREYAFRPGDISCIQNGTVYSYEVPVPAKHWCIHFHDPYVAETKFELPDLISVGGNSIFYRDQVIQISRLFNICPIERQIDTVLLESRFRLKALLLSLGNAYLKDGYRKRSETSFSWDALTQWIDEHLSQPISASTLAVRANLSRSTFSQKFRKQFYSTVSRYLLSKRIDKAKSLLVTTTLTVYEIGTSVGISDPQYFNKQFRKMVGVSPSRYRDEFQEYESLAAKDDLTAEGRWVS